MKKISSCITLATLIIFTSSCGILKTKYADWEYESRGNDINEPNFRDDIYLYEFAHRFGLMALFANVSYRDDLLSVQKKIDDTGELLEVNATKNNQEKACEYINSNAPAPIYGMPYTSSGKWMRWKGNSKVESQPCFNEKGLFYETYVYLENNTITEAVIAFRGTENKGSQFWHDWQSNLASVFGFEPEQYRIASEKIPNVLKALKLENPHIKIYATGHSLGGGLAQQAGYLSKDILEVFTFNTTPVTNWTNLSLKGKVQNRYPKIHRIYNGGEVLGGIRSVTTLFTEARYGRHDIGIQVKPKKLISGHSMTLLSCHLACLIENKDEEAEHHLLPSFIRNELMTNSSMCTGFVATNNCSLNMIVE